MNNEKITLNPRDGWMGWFPKGGLKTIVDPENGRISNFLEDASQQLPENSKILDASAGQCPYRKHFKRHQYESCDVPGGFYQNEHDFECLLDDIPKPDHEYDAVILTQVLEHVPSPLNVLKEINRVLKPGGKLMISVPLNCPLHGLPWHFFNFTHFALNELARETGYVMIECEKVGGAFWFYGKNLQTTNRQIMKSMDPFRAKKRGKDPVLCTVFTILYAPVWLIFRLLLSYFFRPACYWLDRLDSDKMLTLGYTAVFLKADSK